MSVVEIGACGIRLVCLLLAMTGLHRFVGASFGSQPQSKRSVEEAMVAYTHEEPPRLAQRMMPKAMTVTQDETFTGGLCLVAIEPVSNDILLEHTPEARDHHPWHTLTDRALTPFKGKGIPSTSDEAPGYWHRLRITWGSTTHPTSCMCNTSCARLSQVRWRPNSVRPHRW